MPSGLHFTLSGPRPRMPPGWKISSMVSSFWPGDAGAEEAWVCASKTEQEKASKTHTAKRTFTAAPVKEDIAREEVYISARDKRLSCKRQVCRPNMPAQCPIW